MLADKGVEIHATVANFMSESGERDDPGLFQRMTQKIDHISAGIQDDRHRVLFHLCRLLEFIVLLRSRVHRSEYR
jgi:hypothetical protein